MDDQEKQNVPQELDLEDIMKEFSPEDGETEELPEEITRQVEAMKEFLQGQPQAITTDTIRLDDLSQVQETVAPSAEEPVEEPTKDVTEEPTGEPAEVPAEEPPEKAQPYSEDWEPEYDEPIAEYVPPRPILFQPRSRLRELKRKLVEGPEKRYYALSELGTGKLQVLIFLSLIVFFLSAGATVLYALGKVGPSRMKLMVFSQFFALLLSGLLGCQQMLQGVAELLHKRFTLNFMLLVTFAACVVDGVFCLRQQRVPCCAAFSLQVTMALWAAYHRRVTQLGQMDTLRKAIRLDNVVAAPDYFEGKPGLLRGEGEVEDFMDSYDAPSAPEKVQSVYALAVLLMSIVGGVGAGILHKNVSFGVQVFAVSLLASVPVASFVVLTRPMALLEKRLHAVGAVLCGWKGVKGLCGKAVFPVSHDDLFPAGACNLNGVKFYGSRDPDQVVEYAAALMSAGGGGLEPLFTYLLDSRNGRHYDVEKLQFYTGGIGGEVDGESVLLGTPSFLKDMGVEIPQGTRVNQAVYAAIDGELCGLFAITYRKEKAAAAGLGALCADRGLRTLVTSGDFMLSPNFLHSRFGVNPKRVTLPERAVCQTLAAKEPPEEASSLALITGTGLAPFAFAVTGARSLHTASVSALAVQMLGGVLGLAMMLILAVFGAGQLLTPANMLLYELVWLIPGLLITEWTHFA